MCGLKFLALTILFISWFAITLALEERVQIFPPYSNVTASSAEEAVMRVRDQIDIAMVNLHTIPAELILNGKCPLKKEDEDVCSVLNGKCPLKKEDEDVCFEGENGVCPICEPNHTCHKDSPVFRNSTIDPFNEKDKLDEQDISSIKTTVERSNEDGVAIPRNISNESRELVIPDKSKSVGTVYGPLRENESPTPKSDELHESFLSDCIIPEIIPERFVRMLGIRKIFPSSDKRTVANKSSIRFPVFQACDDPRAEGSCYRDTAIVNEIRRYLEPIHESLTCVQETLNSVVRTQNLITESLLTTNVIVDELLSEIRDDRKYLMEIVENRTLEAKPPSNKSNSV